MYKIQKEKFLEKSASISLMPHRPFFRYLELKTPLKHLIAKRFEEIARSVATTLEVKIYF
jgi:hypothetical protein